MYLCMCVSPRTGPSGSFGSLIATLRNYLASVFAMTLISRPMRCHKCTALSIEWVRELVPDMAPARFRSLGRGG